MLYNIIFILRGNNRLSLFKIPIILEHLFEIVLMWLCQFNCSLKLIPRKLNSSTLSIYVLSIFIFSGFIILFLLAVLKIIYLDLFTFRDNLFNLSHSLILSSSVLIKNSTFLFLLYCAKESRVLESVVSSAYIIKLNFGLDWAVIYVNYK